jgi:N-glycosylase/DNA lyase
MDLDQTLCCGQCFRWEPCAERPGAWQGIAAAQCIIVWIENDILFAQLPDGADLSFWQRYFALDVDYPALQQRFCAGSVRLARCVQAAPGIRVLRQPFFETLCSFIISQNNNIPRIRGIVEHLCALYGPSLGGGKYGFPTAQTLSALKEADLAPLRAGWRAAYLLDAAQRVAQGMTEDSFSILTLDEARALLQLVHGVGPKVADCVLLYSLGRWDVCPMDVWMKRAMRLLFARGMPRCAAGYEGIAQQYIFAWARANLPRGG